MIRPGINLEMPTLGKEGPIALGHQPAGKRPAKDFTVALEEHGRSGHGNENGKKLARAQGPETKNVALGEKSEILNREVSHDEWEQFELARMATQLVASGSAGGTNNPDTATFETNWVNDPGLFTSSDTATIGIVLAGDQRLDTTPSGPADAINFIAKPERANVKSAGLEQLTHPQGLAGRGKTRDDVATEKQYPVPVSPKMEAAEAQKLPTVQTIVATGQSDHKVIGGPVPLPRTLGDSANPNVHTGSSPPSFVHALSPMVEAGLIGPKITSKLNSLHFHMTVPEFGSFSVRFGGRDEVASVALTPTGTEKTEEVMALQEEMNLWLAQTSLDFPKSDVSLQTGQSAPTLPDQPQNKDRRDGTTSPENSGHRRRQEDEAQNSGKNGLDRHPREGASEKLGKWQNI